MGKHKIAIIGGTGFDSIEGFVEKEGAPNYVQTPFDTILDSVTGRSSSYPVDVAEGTIEGVSGVEFLLIKRHGLSHGIPASQVNHRANAYATLAWGADFAVGITAVGALNPDIKVGDFVIPTGLFRHDPAPGELDYYGRGTVVHMDMHEPFSRGIAGLIYDACRNSLQQDSSEVFPHAMLPRATLVLINKNNSFSTPEESRFFREVVHGDIIGMTAYEALPFALLGIPYAALALVVDRDNIPDAGKDTVTQTVVNTNVELFRERVGKILRTVAELTPSLEKKIAFEREVALRRLGAAVIGSITVDHPKLRDRLLAARDIVHRGVTL